MADHNNRNKPNHALRLARKARAWKQRELASEIVSICRTLRERRPSVDANAVSRWERGVVNPCLHYQRLLCLVFELPPQDLGFPTGPGLVREVERSSKRLAAGGRPTRGRAHRHVAGSTSGTHV